MGEKIEIQIDEEVKAAIAELGNTFDTPNDVIRRILNEAGYRDLLDLNNGNMSKTMNNEPIDSGASKNRMEERIHNHPEIELMKIKRSGYEAKIGGE
ncbi:MAG: hypothetical protein SXQ77_10390, partial [Halobacteria archaeon]|nr:hypothetical protein [Halobacteria archaeon]